jgi:hypothetical protein
LNAETPSAIVAPAPEPAPAPNALFLELLGNGILYSINYERMLDVLPLGALGLRAGASYFSRAVSDAAGAGNLKLATFPIVASWYVGWARHKIQVGLGATFLYTSASTDSAGIQYGDNTALRIAATGVVGYRYQPDGHGITFGAGFTPLLRTGKGFLPWGGASVGYAF